MDATHHDWRPRPSDRLFRFSSAPAHPTKQPPIGGFGGRMARVGRQLSARGIFRGVVAVGFLTMLGANLPGHLSYDSVAQLSEGHFHVRETWGPALYAWLLGVFDG